MVRGYVGDALVRLVGSHSASRRMMRVQIRRDPACVEDPNEREGRAMGCTVRLPLYQLGELVRLLFLLFLHLFLF